MGDPRNDFDQLLQQRRWLDPIPPALQRAYRAQRLEEFTRLVRLWAPLLPISVIAFLAFALTFYTAELHGPDLTLLLSTEGLTVVLILSGLLVAYQPAWRLSFDRWI